MRTKRQRREDNKKPNHKIKTLEAKTDNQRDYIRSIVENDIIFCSGPAGSGKSFIAAGIAAQHLHHSKIEQIIVTRPLVCTGKDIGSLPGEMGEKIAPYLLPMKENLKHFLGQAYYGLYSNEGQIQYKPLEVMRGSTFHNSYMILTKHRTVLKIKLKCLYLEWATIVKLLSMEILNKTTYVVEAALSFA